MTFQPRSLRLSDLSLPQDNTAQMLAGLGQALMQNYESGKKSMLEEKEREAVLAANAAIMGGASPSFAAPQQQPLASLGQVQPQQPQQQTQLPVFAQIQGGNTSPSLKALVENANKQYGLPEGYLTRTAQIESGFNPSAKNPNSSASGLFQFINSTAKQYGLSNPFDPVASTDAAARFAADNKRVLAQALGREPTAGELYLAHQKGAGGAVKLLLNPDANAAGLIGKNEVTLNGGTTSMTAGEHVGNWLRKFGGAGVPSQGAVPIQAQAFASQQPSQVEGVASRYEKAAQVLAAQAQATGNINIAKKAQELYSKAQELKSKETYGFQTVGDQLVRTNPRTGQVEAVMQKPMNPLDEELKKAQIEKMRAEASGGAGKYGLNPVYGQDAEGNPILLQLSDRGAAQATKLPDGVKVSNKPIQIQTATGTILIDPVTRQEIKRIDKNVAEGERQKEIGQVEGTQIANAPQAISTADQTLKVIGQIRSHPGRSWGTGITSKVAAIPGTDAYGFAKLVDQAKGQAFLQAFASLKGGGAITEMEGQKATDAIARLDRAQSAKDFDTALNDLEEIVTNGKRKASGYLRGRGTQAQQPQQGEWQDMGGGIRIRAK